MIVSVRLVKVVIVALIAAADGDGAKAVLLLATTCTAGDLSFKMGRETLATGLTMAVFEWSEPADGTFDLK